MMGFNVRIPYIGSPERVTRLHLYISSKSLSLQTSSLPSTLETFSHCSSTTRNLLSLLRLLVLVFSSTSLQVLLPLGPFFNSRFHTISLFGLVPYSVSGRLPRRKLHRRIFYVRHRDKCPTCYLWAQGKRRESGERSTVTFNNDKDSR